MEKDCVNSVGLIIAGDDLNPDNITKLLGMDPDMASRKGDVKHFSNGGGYTHRWGLWKKFTNDEEKDAPLDEQLRYWCALLEGRIGALESIQLDSCNVFLDCFLISSDSTSFNLPHDLLYSLASLKVDLKFTFFPRCEA